MGIFEGCFGESGCLQVVFCGEVVVNCMVNRGGLMTTFCAAKNMPTLTNFSVEISSGGSD
jgi:hypothetical protein